MWIRPHELEIEESSLSYGLHTPVRYFTLPQEKFGGLVRQLTLTNLASKQVKVGLLDGMAVPNATMMLFP